MESLIFSLNATVPVFLMMLLGILFRKIGWMDEEFAARINKFVFMIPLPVLVFEDLATVDFSRVWNLPFVLFCFFASLVSIVLAAVLSFVWKDKSIQGEFTQASYRSSAALLGVALIQNIYGDAGMAPLMIIGSVPLYNIMAVVVLSSFHPGEKQLNAKTLWGTLKSIVTNPIIIAILLGLLWSALKIPMPYVIGKTISSIGAAATPLGLMAMGASFDFKKAFGKPGPSLLATALKLVGFAALFLPLAVWMGFRREELVAILVMLGSATTVSSFVMAKSMGHEGTLTSGVVMLTTLMSAFTLTLWLYVLKVLGLI